MHIPIQIPIGVRNVAVVHGAIWRFVSCAYCRQSYAYLVELAATGEDVDLLFWEGEASVERARAQAKQNLFQKSCNVVLPIPCPSCGTYQDDMSRALKEKASINSLQIAGAVVAVLSLFALAFGIPYIWMLIAIAFAVAGLALLAYGYVVAFCFDPNAGDPEARKELGRRHAVWGEQLAKLRHQLHEPNST